MTGDDIAYVALALVPGIGRSRFDRLIRQFKTAANVMSADHDALVAVPRMSTAAATAIKESNLDHAARVVAQVEELGGTVLLPRDERFPPALRTIPETPTLLFGIGRLDLLRGPGLAVVGSRAHSRYGAEVCRHLAGGAAKAGITVVSGMARGLDAVAHTAALDVNGRTVGVLGNGLGVVYPSANTRLYERMIADGCLITEFPPGERPNAGSFPRRNRLISGLAQCTLVIEAGKKSGTLITVDQALAQGRDVLVVPGPVISPSSLGCNRLIQQGAKLVIGLQDVLEEYALVPKSARARPPAKLNEEERQLLDALGAGVDNVDDLAERLDVPAAQVLAVLTGLEIRGLVLYEAGGVVREALPV